MLSAVDRAGVPTENVTGDGATFTSVEAAPGTASKCSSRLANTRSHFTGVDLGGGGAVAATRFNRHLTTFGE